MQQNTIKIWDLFIRIFHWSLVLTFIVSYISEDDFQIIHVNAGYVMIGLILLRILWGFIGSQYARFSSFVTSPKETLNYIKDVKNFKAKRYLGHNPAGAAMVIALLISLSMTLIFGLLVYGADEFSGPFAGLLMDTSPSMVHDFEEIHEFFANATLFLIIIHILGVLLASFQHKENLLKSMITGYKKTNNTHRDASK